MQPSTLNVQHSSFNVQRSDRSSPASQQAHSSLLFAADKPISKPSPIRSPVPEIQVSSFQKSLAEGVVPHPPDDMDSALLLFDEEEEVNSSNPSNSSHARHDKVDSNDKDDSPVKGSVAGNLHSSPKADRSSLDSQGSCHSLARSIPSSAKANRR